MKALRTLAYLGAGAAAVLALAAAQRPPLALAQASPGSWELSGLPGRSAPVRRCIRDLSMLAQIEHQGRSCTRVVISDAPARTVIHYTCTDGGFGQSQMTALTPRSLRIETQGISNNAPFNYVVQARRAGSC